jgi:hypothetical protein
MSEAQATICENLFERKFMRREKRRLLGRRLAFKPRAFDIDQVMAPSFGIFDGDGVPVSVRVQFREKGVRLIEERTWHSTEKIEHQPRS